MIRITQRAKIGEGEGVNMEKKTSIPDELRCSSAKLKGVGYLIETNVSTGCPDDIEEINQGISIILFEIADSLQRISEQIELKNKKQS
jgi:hypothetical protein